MQTNEVKFRDLKNYNDGNSAVLMGVIVSDESAYKVLDDYLQNKLGFSKGKNLIGVHRIVENVLGDEGRIDWLLEFDHEEIPFNFIARLQFDGLKWTSDFIDNYAEDYI